MTVEIIICPMNHILRFFLYCSFFFLSPLGELEGACFAQEHVRLTNLPHIYINTFSGKGITSKEVYVYARMWYVDEEDNVTMYDSLEIRGRGNSTWNLSKKPYKLKFHEKEKFLGKGYAKAKQWTLLANAGDKTLIRNAITSEMGQFLGLKFNPAAKFCDLTLNGVFMGNYQISDQVEVRAHRVNIIEQDYPLNEESDITGGYLLEVDGFKDGNCFTTSRCQVPIRIHYPDDEEIADNQNQYIRQYMRDFETILFSDDFADATKGYRAWVDSTSLVNWFIATEVCANIDGYFSTYFYKNQQDSLLYWGPLWDYDIAYDNDYRIAGNTRKLMTDVGYGQTKVWLNRMWQDPWFCRLVFQRYQQVVDEGLETYMMQKIDSLSNLLQRSQEINYQKWGISKRMYHENVLYSSYDQYVQDLKDFITLHMDYLLQEFASRKPVEPTPPFRPANYYYQISNANNGNVFDIKPNNDEPYSEDRLPEPQTNVCGWQQLADRPAQEWQITPVSSLPLGGGQEGASLFFIQNRMAGLALNDPTPDPSTATTNAGTQLNVALPDSTDERQLWILTPQGTDGYYNLTNLHTQHTANLSGGGSSNGTAIISYNTDERNSTSKNRLWRLLPTTPLPEPPVEPVDTTEIDPPIEPVDTLETDTVEVIDGINLPDLAQPQNHSLTPEPAEYALAYNPVLQQLHFAAEDPNQLTFTAYIYTSDGRLLRSFPSSQPHSVSDLPQGLYLITWHVGPHLRSTKFVK